MDDEMMKELPKKENILIPRLTVEQTQISQATNHLPRRVSLAPILIKTNYQTKILEAANRMQQFRRENEPFFIDKYPQEVGRDFNPKLLNNSIINSSKNDLGSTNHLIHEHDILDGFRQQNHQICLQRVMEEI